MRLTAQEVKQTFIDVILKKKSFEEASDWASKMIRMDDLGEIECEPSHLRIIFGGLAYLTGIDLVDTSGSYLHSIENIKDKFHKLFGSDEKIF